MRTTSRVLTVSTVLVLAASLAQAGERKLNPYTPGVNGVTAPKVIAESARPVALPEDGSAGNGAVLTVSTVVRKDGSVAEVRVLDCSVKGAGLEAAAAATIREWRFEPGTWRGMAVDTVKTMQIHLGSAASAAAEAATDGIPVAATLGGPEFDPMFATLKLPGSRGPQAQLPNETDPQYRRPTVVEKPSCQQGETCLYEKAPGTKDSVRLVGMPIVASGGGK
ncbi:MAG TPA: TonB family protein [Candidatus Polarisedimenticolaceae bacterium]